MADSLTLIQEFVKPQVGGSAGTWGTKLNTDADGYDSLLSIPRIQRQVLADGVVTMVVSAGTVGKIAITQNTTISFSGFAADTTPFKPSQRVLLQITGDGVHTVTFTGVTWLSGITPVLTTAIVHYIEIFTVDNGTTKYGVHHGALDDAEVTAAKLAANAVTTAAILDANVTAAKLADDAINPAKMDGASFPRRYKIHLAIDQSLPQNVDTTISWAGAATDWNVGTFIADNNGLKIPAADTANHLLVLTAQFALETTGDSTADDSAVVRVWVEDDAGNILAESWVNTDAQNGNAVGWRIQVRAEVNNPGSAVVYRVKARSYLGAGAHNMLATKTWFSAVLF
jgi:hypothetical protein